MKNFLLCALHANQSKQQLHFALLDIDDFKRLNDSRGHDFGDLVLCRLVAVYSELLSDNEHLVRMGGDEFLLILSCTDPVAVAEQGAVLLGADPQLSSEGSDLQVHVCVGLVTVQPDSGAFFGHDLSPGGSGALSGKAG